MKNDAVIQVNVQAAIKWEPLLNAAEIEVEVKEAVVTLSGTVDSYTKKSQAEQVAKNVKAVKAVVQEIEIRLPHSEKITDTEIAEEVLRALQWSSQVPDNKVTIQVEDGWVALEGELHWNYQREAAKDALQHLKGVKGVANNIRVRSQSHETIEKLDIESALRRNWSINDDDIDVEVTGTKVTLTGTVKSWYQRNEAEKISWNAPGVWEVANNLVVEYDPEIAA